VQKQTLRWAGECTKIRSSRPRNCHCFYVYRCDLTTSFQTNTWTNVWIYGEMKTISGKGALGDTQSHTPPSHALGACCASILAPSALDLAPKPKSWTRPPTDDSIYVGYKSSLLLPRTMTTDGFYGRESDLESDLGDIPFPQKHIARRSSASTARTCYSR